MYFNPQVKNKKNDFFNFEVLQEELKSALLDNLTPLIAVYGLRRTGKTSLIRVVLNSMGRKHVWIDSRHIISGNDFHNKLSAEIDTIRKFKVDSVTVKGMKLSLNFMKKGLSYLNSNKIVLVVDEAQLLKRLRLDNFIAFVYDNFPKIKVIISGSESGMLKSFLGYNNAKAPLYGRAVCELHTHRLDKEGGFTFLKEGAKQAKMDMSDEEAIKTIQKLDGIIGWLTKYGWYRMKNTPKESLRRTIAEGQALALDEFTKFATKAEARYKALLKTMLEGARWEDLKKQNTISDKQLHSMTHRLIAYGFVEKQNGLYTIADPLLEEAIS